MYFQNEEQSLNFVNSLELDKEETESVRFDGLCLDVLFKEYPM